MQFTLPSVLRVSILEQLTEDDVVFEQNIMDEDYGFNVFKNEILNQTMFD